MKAFFWILLLANIIFFSVMRWGGLQDNQTAPLLPPLQVEKISLLNAPKDYVAASAPAPASATVSSPVVVSAPVAVSAPAVVPASAPEPLAARCMEWGEFSGADLARATVALSRLQLGDRLRQLQVEYAIGYWVYIPPMKDKATASRKVAQLKALGIEDYFIISEAGPWLNAISLGVFKTKEAAQRFLDDLQRTKEVRTAMVGERASKLKVTKFVLNGLDAKSSTDLAEIAKSFAGSELKDISCVLTR